MTNILVNTKKKKRPMSLERLTIVPHTSQCCAQAININSLEKTEILAFWASPCCFIGVRVYFICGRESGAKSILGKAFFKA